MNNYVCGECYCQVFLVEDWLFFSENMYVMGVSVWLHRRVRFLSGFAISWRDCLAMPISFWFNTYSTVTFSFLSNFMKSFSRLRDDFVFNYISPTIITMRKANLKMKPTCGERQSCEHPHRVIEMEPLLEYCCVDFLQTFNYISQDICLRM